MSIVDLGLEVRKIYAITTALNRAPEYIEDAPRDVLCGALDAISEIAERAHAARYGKEPGVIA